MRISGAVSRENRKLFGRMLKKHRLRCGMSWGSVAWYIGVSTRCVAYWESGSRIPTYANIDRLINFLELTPTEALCLRRVCAGLPEKDVASFTDLVV
jgi:DNA-binding transcriptional regulator YiaG